MRDDMNEDIGGNSTRTITVKCLNHGRHSDGKIWITLPSVPITIEEEAVLQRLFPHLAEQVYRMLDAEALIDAITN